MSVRPDSPRALSSVSARRGGRRSGAVDILLAAALWGTAGPVFTLAPASASPVSAASARIVLGGALLFALVAFSSRRTALRGLLRQGRRAWLPLVLGAVCGAVYQVTYLASVALTGVAIATVVSLGSAPAFAGLLTLRGLGRRWSATTAGAVAGCALLMSGGEASGADPGGVALALFCGFTYAAYTMVAARLIERGADDQVVMGSIFGGAAVLLLPVLLAGSPGWLLDVRGAAVACYLGAVGTAASYVLFARGLRTTSGATATTLSLAEPAVAAIIGLVLLGEHLGGVALAGLGLLAVSLVTLVFPERK
ncbi:transporter [Actinomadura sp. NBRC 104425]|uniref:EamA family transporter n=1 Tax=Actinomadura sp. NBRC 104425 TaxID=3032204 RepID=UPI0024A282A1|nr:EamA family transporter [Actinomadura sp. NBRC 104425]GLZ10493.1 transporter [Actinomadura sp. NBRC 104425]